MIVHNDSLQLNRCSTCLVALGLYCGILFNVVSFQEKQGGVITHISCFQYGKWIYNHRRHL